jgi:hypothetical protein
MDTHALYVWKCLYEGSQPPEDVHTGYLVLPVLDGVVTDDLIEAFWVEIGRGSEAEMEAVLKLINRS